MKNPFNSDFKSDKTLADVPLWIENSNEFISEWSEKARSFFAIEKSRLKVLQDNISTSENSAELQQYIQDKSSHLKTIEKLLSELLNDTTLDKEQLSYSPTQSFFSYTDLIFRDWCWKSEDLEAYQNYCIQNLKSIKKGNTLFLGAGASRLPYEVAKEISAEVYSLELNPLLVGCAQKVLSGKSLKLYDFPKSPNLNGKLTKKWELPVVKDTPENLHLGIGDFYDLPFEKSSFDSIVACWFYDILDDSLTDLLKHTKYYLKDGGSVLFIGPSNFHKSNITDSQTQESMIKIFKDNGFEVTFETKSLPYLKGEGHASWRMETVLFMNAKMIDNESELIDSKSFSIDPTQPIPALPEIQKQYNEHQIFSVMLKHIDGNKSISDIAPLIAQELSLTPEEAYNYAYGFFNKLIWTIKTNME